LGTEKCSADLKSIGLGTEKCSDDPKKNSFSQKDTSNRFYINESIHRENII